MSDAVKMGTVIELDIHGQPYGPEALGRLHGMAVFVDSAVPGDRVRAEVTEVRPRYVRARTTELLSASPWRVPHECPVADRCGGCQWQATTYVRQLAAKEQAVRDALVRIGGWRDPQVEAISPSPRQWGYRNRASYAVGVRDGVFQAGYHGRRSHDIVPIRSCPLNMPELDQVLGVAIDMLSDDAGLRNVAEALHALAARQSESNGDIILRLIVEKKVPLRPFAERIASECRNVVGVTTNLSGRRRRPHDRVILGRGYLIQSIRARMAAGARTAAGDSHAGGDGDAVAEWTYRVSSSSFFQVNPFAAPELVDRVCEAADVAPGQTVLDAYGGVGLFSLPLAMKGVRVHLVESDAGAAADARRTFRAHGLSAARVHQEAVEQMTERIPGADVVICDPPRAGAGHAALAGLLTRTPRRFVYVACDPASLARDSVTLRDAGYDLRRAWPIDLFPHTFHVETVALFER